MLVTTTFDYSSVHDFIAWGGAIPVLTEMHGAAFDYVDAHIESLYPDGIDENDLNEWLWFDCEDWLRETHGVNLDGTPINEDDED